MANDGRLTTLQQSAIPLLSLSNLLLIDSLRQSQYNVFLLFPFSPFLSAQQLADLLATRIESSSTVISSPIFSPFF